MHSVSDADEGREHSAYEDREVSRDADRLISEHGEEADSVAARKADSLFREGDMLGGARWLRIFRRIATAHRRRAAG